jgi:hypothetical protein
LGEFFHRRRWLGRRRAIFLGLPIGFAVAFFALVYPALSPPALEKPAVSLDSREGKAVLESLLTVEVRGSLSTGDVRKRLQVSPGIDLSETDIAVKHIASLPWHEGLPWAKTRVTLKPRQGWSPETDYQVSLEDEQFSFETISLPRIDAVLAEETGDSFANLPTHRGIVIRFNEEVNWDDSLLSLDPAADVKVTRQTPDEILIKPVGLWLNHQEYTVTIDRSITDAYGHQAREDQKFSFTTWPAPKIVSASPEGADLTPASVLVEVQFERPADRASVEAAFKIEPAQVGAFEWPSDTKMVWRPAGLPYSTAFAVSVGGLAVGGDLFETRSWKFDTHDPPVFVELQGGYQSPAILTAVATGGLGQYSVQWNTGETGNRILAAAPYGQTRNYTVTVTSGDRTAIAGVDMKGVPWPNFMPQACPAGWYMTDISVCTRTDELPGPVRTHIARIDLRDPSLAVTSLPSTNSIGSAGTVSAAARAAGSIVAVNGDLFHAVEGGLYPVGPLIGSGGYAYAPASQGAFFALDAAGGVSVGLTPDVRSVVSGAGGDFTISKVNATPGQDELAVFNGYRTAAIGPFDGCLATVTVKGGDLVDEADGIWCGQVQDVPVHPGGFTLVGRGAGADWIQNSTPGWLSVSAQSYSLLVGGSHVLQPSIQAGTGFNVEGRHPRTAIGADASGFLYLVVVDGRSGDSVGMTIPELSAYMGSLGATRAINMDGGGSSTFVVNGAVQNAPADGYERAVTSVVSVGRGRAGCAHPFVRC